MKTNRSIVALALASVAWTGCATVGPKSIRNGRFDYNRAIVETRSEQMLSNLVRLRYRDPPYFLEISSVSTQYVVGAGVVAEVGGIGDRAIGNLEGSAAYEERPTITYLPLQGDEFAQRMLSPVPMESIVLLTHTGWRMDRIFRCCVQRVNELWNAPTASGPTPDRAPTYEAFLEMARRFEALRESEALEIRYRRIRPGESPPVEPLGRGDDAFLLSLRFRTTPGTPEHDNASRLRRLLGLADGIDEFYFTRNPTIREPNEIAVLPRSLMGAMSYLSQSVEPPESDVAAGRVTVTRRPDGSEFDWADLTGGLLRVRSSATRPEDAFVRVRYRDSWFFIDDADLSSKSTFNLLDILFQLQAGRSSGGGPVLTLPVR